MTQNPLERLVEGSLGPLSRLRDSIDLTLDEVSEWIAQPENRRQISNLVTLLDAQTQLIVCQHRLIAVARLADVAASAASPETIRRACADLLKLRLIDPYKEDKRPEKLPPMVPFSPAAEERALAALERLGTEHGSFEMPLPVMNQPQNSKMPDGADGDAPAWQDGTQNQHPARAN